MLCLCCQTNSHVFVYPFFCAAAAMCALLLLCGINRRALKVNGIDLFPKFSGILDARIWVSFVFIGSLLFYPSTLVEADKRVITFCVSL